MRKTLFFFVILFVLLASASALQLPPNVQKMFDDQQRIALGITFLAAFLAGIITFTSPCGFAILPTFFAVAFKEQQRSREMALVFSLGLTTAFTIMGIVAGLMSNFFNPYKLYLAFLSGIVLVIFGILLLLNKGFSVITFQPHRPEKSWGSMFSVGFFFALGWSPCVGTILGGTILLAAYTGTLVKSIALLITYSVGISAPLVFFAATADKYQFMRIFQEKTMWGFPLYNFFGGVILIGMGIIMMSYNGTEFFQQYIPEYLPWKMIFWGEANQFLAQNALMQSTGANILGVILVFLLVVLGWKMFRSVW